MTYLYIMNLVDGDIFVHNEFGSVNNQYYLDAFHQVLHQAVHLLAWDEEGNPSGGGMASDASAVAWRYKPGIWSGWIKMKRSMNEYVKMYLIMAQIICGYISI